MIIYAQLPIGKAILPIGNLIFAVLEPKTFTLFAD